jgi:hypothetical protein
VRAKKINEPDIATVPKSNVDDLRRRTREERTIIEIDILTEDRKSLYCAELLKLSVGCGQKIAIK